MARNSAYLLILSAICLVALGLVMLLSVSAFARDNQGNAMFFITRQLIWLAFGVSAGGLVAWLDYHKWVKYAWWLVALSAVLILCCFVPGLGRAIKGAHRWLILGSFNVQPSELCKLSVIVFFAYWFEVHATRLQQGWQGVVPPVAVMGGLCGLLVLQPDLGTAAVIVIISFLMMFTAGVALRYILPLPAVGLGGILTMALLMPERLARLLAFLQPEVHRAGKGYQVWQGLIALGSGGPTGLGLGNSMQKMSYVPETHTDFIFPIIGEELGLVCTLMVVLCFLLIALAGGYIAFHAPDRMGTILGVGCLSFICLQAGMNIAVVTSLMPAKGIGLPFISYGGSNLVACLICMGILLNIHRQAEYASEEGDSLLTQWMEA